jgi:starch-binding outer membrane protein, SusD/RagB family
MKIKKIFTCMVFFTIAFNYSCKEDFLEITPEGKLFESTYYSDEKAGEEAIIAIYNLLNADWPISMGRIIPMMGDQRADDEEHGNDPANFNGETDGSKDLAYHNIFADDRWANDWWAFLFAGVQRTNLAIKGIKNIPDDGFSEPENRDILLAEARYMRAYFYIHLVKNFGGVPIIEKQLVPSEFDVARNTAEETFQFIYDDLAYAIKWLPLKSQTEIGRGTVGAAIYCMVQALIFEAGSDLNHSNWQEAYDYAARLVKGDLKSEYKLLTVEDGFTYGDVFNVDGNDEIILEVVPLIDNSQANSWYIEYATPRYVQDEEGNRLLSFGWGTRCPTQSIVDAFETNQDWSDTQQWEDPRLSYSVYREGDIVPIGQSDKDRVNDSLEIYLEKPDIPTGYYRKKYVMEKEPNQWYPEVNPKLHRFSDLILMYAEAAYCLSKEDEARSALNMIRARARQGQPGNVLPDITATGQELLQAIWDERRVELCFEHHRFYDLVRTGKVKEALDAYGKDFVVGKHELLPIPQAEIDLNPNLEQNPGY